jgi:hypothetical protein
MRWMLSDSAARRDNRRLMERMRLVPSVCVFALACGCGGNGTTSAPPNTLPTPPSAATKNSYTGTQNPGLWSLTLDDSATTFSYQPVTYPITPNVATQGSFSATNGFLDFGSVNGDSVGLAIEIPGSGGTLRPGDNTTAPVEFAQQSACYAINGNVRFIFAGPPATQQPQASGSKTDLGFVAYGTIVMSTSADGKTWQFTDWREYQLPEISGGTAVGTPEGSNPLSFTAQCAATNGQAIVTAEANPVFTVSPAFSVNQAGFFIEDASPSTYPSPSTQPLSWVGAAMPASPLTASAVAAVSYSGFVYEPNNPTTPVVTQPVAFSPASGVSGSLSGGIYANDELTGSPGSQYTIALGPQDSALNGVFPHATLTMPDPQYYCAANNQNIAGLVEPGFDINGNPICTTDGVAVVAGPLGNYVIYFSSLDGTLGEISTGGIGTPVPPHILQMYLYQQQ